MISLALFPCSYIDNARIVGELASCLERPVYCDEMVIATIRTRTGRSPRKVYSRLFGRRDETHKTVKERNEILSLVRSVLAELIERLFFGIFDRAHSIIESV